MKNNKKQRKLIIKTYPNKPKKQGFWSRLFNRNENTINQKILNKNAPTTPKECWNNVMTQKQEPVSKANDLKIVNDKGNNQQNKHNIKNPADRNEKLNDIETETKDNKPETMQDKQNKKSLSEMLKGKNTLNPSRYVVPVFVLLCINLAFSFFVSANSVSGTNNNANNINASRLSATLADAKPDYHNLSSKQMFMKGLENVKQSKNLTVTVNGKIKSVVEQKVSLTRMYDGKTYFAESKTSGFKNAASRTYSDNSTVKLYRAPTSNLNNFNVKPKSFSHDQFEKEYSISANALVPYNINDYTIIGGSKPQALPNGGYSFYIYLHPQHATTNYGKNIQKLAKLKEAPEFVNITFNVELDSDLNFTSIEVTEKFFVKVFGIKTEANSQQKTVFDFKTPVRIPAA